MKRAVKLLQKIGVCLGVSLTFMLPGLSAQPLELSWDASPEADISHYVIYRDTLSGTYKPYATVQAAQTSFSDHSVEQNRTYFYKLTAVDYSGNESAATPELSATTGVLTSTGENLRVPGEFRLAQNYPNPFNPTTTIDYAIPAKGRAQLLVFNALGMKIRTLVDDLMEKGNYSVEWDGKDDNGNALSTGIYFYQLLSAGQRSMQKAVLQK